MGNELMGGFVQVQVFSQKIIFCDAKTNQRKNLA